MMAPQTRSTTRRKHNLLLKKEEEEDVKPKSGEIKRRRRRVSKSDDDIGQEEEKVLNLSEFRRQLEMRWKVPLPTPPMPTISDFIQHQRGVISCMINTSQQTRIAKLKYKTPKPKPTQVHLYQRAQHHSNTRHFKLQMFFREMSFYARLFGEDLPKPLKIHNKIISLDDFLQKMHKTQTTAMYKSADEFIRRAIGKSTNLKNDFTVTFVHCNRISMLEEDHQERMEMIEMLSEKVRTWAGNKVEGLLLAMHEDMIVHLQWHLEEERAFIQRMIGETTTVKKEEDCSKSDGSC